MRLVTAVFLPVALWATGDEDDDPPAPPTYHPTARWVVQSQQQDYTRAPIIYPDEEVPFQVFPGPPVEEQTTESPTTSPSPEPTPQPTDYPVAKAFYYGAGCTEGYFRVGDEDEEKLCISLARLTSDYADDTGATTNCQPIEDLCIAEGGTLATKEETRKFIENGGDTLEMKYGLTSTRQGNDYWFTDGTGDLGWNSGSCHEEDRFFVCAVMSVDVFEASAMTEDDKAEQDFHAERDQECKKLSKVACVESEMCEWDDGGQQGEEAAECHLNVCYGMKYKGTCESNSQYCKWNDDGAVSVSAAETDPATDENGECAKKACSDYGQRSVCPRHCRWEEDDIVKDARANARDAEEGSDEAMGPTPEMLEHDGICEDTFFYEEGTVTCEGYKLGDGAVTAYVTKEDMCEEACVQGKSDCIGYWTFSHIDLQSPNHKFFCAIYVYKNVSWRPRIKCGDKYYCEFGNIRGDNFKAMDGAEVNKCRSHALGTRSDEEPPKESSSEDYDRLDVWVLLLAILVACCFAVGGFYTYNYIRDEELKRELTREAMLGNDEVYHYTADDTARSDGPGRAARGTSTGFI